MNGSQIVAFLEGYRYDGSTELAYQDGVATVLTAAGVEFCREVNLSPVDRIDFMIGTVGVECKVRASLAGMTRQLHRYAQHERVSELVLITTRHQLTRVPRKLFGKSIHVCLTPGEF